ncbi:TlpA family protein disulfide reductase [Streptomyces sp. NPDC054808]
MSAASRAPLRSNRTNRTADRTTGHASGRASRRVRSRVRSRAALAVGAAAAALLVSACSSGGTSGGGGQTGFITGSDGIATAKEGERADAPDLSGETVDGGQVDVADYKGKVVVLNVWGSWCPPCRAEAKNFEKVYQDVKDQGVQFVGINTRDTSTGPARAFEKDYGVTYPSLYDPSGKLLLRFEKGTLNPQAVPSTLIIDREGKVAARTLQALSEEKLRKMLAPYLAGGSGGSADSAKPEK